jgi:dihydrolipoamide dehydrogenase
MAKRRKWRLKLGVRVGEMTTREEQAHLSLENGEIVTAEKALVAVGRSPNTADIGLEEHGVALDERGFVKVDEHLRAAPGVYAIGDVNGQAMLAHTASHQAEYLADYLATKNLNPYHSGPVPWLIWGGIESVRVGPTASELAAEGHDVRLSRATLAGNPAAQAAAETMGLVKIAWTSGKVAGISVAGHAATHLATQAVIMVAQAWTREDVNRYIFAHPTLDESLKQALLAEQQAE